MHKVLQPSHWAPPRGYVNGVAARGTQVFVAGQIGWNADCTFDSDDLVEQTRQALLNVIAVLAEMLADAYFTLPAPKSTGRDLFHAAWLTARLGIASAPIRPEDVQATLAELTATACANDVLRHASAAGALLVCGGGAFNAHLMGRLSALLPGHRVLPTDARGLPATQVEAAAFAWLACAYLDRRPGNLPSVTGAAGDRILGALYPAA